MNAPEVVEPKIEPYTKVVVHKTNWFRRVLLFVLVAFVLAAAITGGAIGTVLHNRHQAVTSPTRPASNGTLWTDNNSLPVPNPQGESSCRGGICPFTIATITWTDTQFIFGLSANRSLVYKAGSSNQWNATWSNLGGNFTHAPVVVSPNPGSLAAIGIQEDQALYWKAYQNGTWESTWTSLGGTWGTAISAVSRSSGFISVYGFESEGGNLQQSAWTPDDDGSAKWVEILNLGGICFGSPSVAAWNSSREDIFVQGSDDNLWHIYWNGTTWSSFERLDGITIVSPPLAVSSGENRLDVFALGEGNTFCWRAYRETWMTWDCTISGNLSFESIPSAAVMGLNRVDAVALASDDHTYHKSLVNSSWTTNWDDLGGQLNGAPVIALFSPNTGSVLGIGMDNGLYIGNRDSSAFNWEGSNTWTSLGGDFNTLPEGTGLG